MGSGASTSTAAATTRLVLAHVIVTAGTVGGLALALLIALPALAPPAPVEAPDPSRPQTVARGSAVLAPTVPDPLPPLDGRVLAGSRAFPVAGEADYAADHHDYPATDVFVACGTPVLAVAAGEVTQTTTVDRWDRATNAGVDRGGLSVTLVGDDGVRYYGSHLQSVAVEPGQRVQAGEVLGLVGDTGSARGTGCHLHLGLSPAQCGPDDWFTRRGVVSPYPYLEQWRLGRDADPGAAVRSWHRDNGCPTAPGAYP